MDPPRVAANVGSGVTDVVRLVAWIESVWLSGRCSRGLGAGLAQADS